jgi:carbonic anhydrase
MRSAPPPYFVMRPSSKDHWLNIFLTLKITLAFAWGETQSAGSHPLKWVLFPLKVLIQKPISDLETLNEHVYGAENLMRRQHNQRSAPILFHGVRTTGMWFWILVFGLVGILPAAPKKESPLPGEALFMLRDGNDRYVNNRFKPRDYVGERKELVQGQQPYAIVVTCSDSRVPPEIIFDESLGKLFVIRVAGNVLDPVLLGSIEYAAEHLHAGLILVLGHESCGAVKAAVEGGEIRGNLEPLLHKIAPAVEHAKKKNSESQGLLNDAIQENVRLQMQTVMTDSSLLRGMVEDQKMWIVGAVYSLQTGKVTWLYTGAHSGTATDSSSHPNKE